MNAYPMHAAVAAEATRARLRATVRRAAELALEENARVGSVLVYGPEGYQAALLLRESLAGLDGWTLIRGIADEREQATDWSLLEVLNASFGRFGVQIETPLSFPGAAGDPAAIGHSLARTVAGIEGPVCIVVENVHFADERSADAIRFGLRRHGPQALMLAMSTESLSSPTARLAQSLSQARPEHNAFVRVPPLTPLDIQELAVERIGQPLAGRVARRFAADAAGNPTLTAALLDAYREELSAAPHPAAVELDRGRQVPLLPRQQRAFETAPPGVRIAAEIVAVLREPTAIATVNRVAAWLGITEAFGAFDLEGAERAGLVRLVEGVAVPTVAPTSRVAADSLAARIPIERRREIHAAAADVVTGPAALHHRIHGLGPEDTTIVAELMDGARTRVAVNDPETAMALALAAVQLAAPGAEYERALLFAGILAVRLHEHQRMFHLMGEIASLPASDLRDAILADLEVLTGRREAGIERARAVVDSVEDSPTAAALRAHAAVMIPLYDAINEHHELVSQHVAAARRVVAAAPRDASGVHPDLRWLVRPAEHELWLTAWELVAAARLRDAERLADRMARLERLLRDAPDSAAVIDAIVYQSRTLAYAGRVADAANRLHRAVRIASVYPGAWLRHTAFTMQAHLLFLGGEWERAVISSRLALERALDDPYRASLPIAYAVMGLVPAARGDVDEVRKIERMLALLPPSGGSAIPYDPDLPDVMRAQLAAALGDTAGQLRATEAARTASRQGTVWSWLWLHVDALVRLGRLAEARSIANLALTGDTPWIRTPQGASRLRARLALAGGDAALARELYAGILQSQTAAAQPFMLAHDRVHYATALHATGHAERAREQLELAATAFRALKAESYLTRVLERLRELAGAPDETAQTAHEPPSAVAAALAGLTVREREVAVAVASGLTNREVAERLYVSVTTVNFHVRNILAKLGLSSRRELRPVLHEDAAAPPPRRRAGRPDQGPIRS